MSDSRAGFLRGTCHLFYEDWPSDSALNVAPPVWSCGDLHFENLGAYKGANRIEYFDLTDFDEAALAPCTWDVTRFATSVLVAAQDHGSGRGLELARSFLESYASSLAAGKAVWVERETATGAIRDLLRRVRRRSRRVLLRKNAPRNHGRRAIALAAGRTLPLRRGEHAELARIVGAFARQQGDAGFYRLLDAAWRLAGNGSAGVPRYVLLVEGSGSPNRNSLLDLKLARPSVLAAYVPTHQPAWHSEAERVVTTQRHLQAVAPAYLAALKDGSRSYILRELQPQEDRLNLDDPTLRPGDFRRIAGTMGCIIASAHLRTASFRGAAAIDDLMAWSSKRKWIGLVQRYAREYARTVDRDWRAFTTALADGAFRAQLPNGKSL